jgi:hypothetical protein
MSGAADKFEAENRHFSKCVPKDKLQEALSRDGVDNQVMDDILRNQVSCPTPTSRIRVLGYPLRIPPSHPSLLFARRPPSILLRL